MFFKVMSLTLVLCLISCADSDTNSNDTSVSWVQLDDYVEIVIPAWDGQMDTVPDYYNAMSTPLSEGRGRFSAFLDLSCDEIDSLNMQRMTSETEVLVIISGTGRCGDWFTVRFEPNGFDYWIRKKAVLVGDTKGVLH